MTEDSLKKYLLSFLNGTAAYSSHVKLTVYTRKGHQLISMLVTNALINFMVFCDTAVN
jgi:hypothetical protein